MYWLGLTMANTTSSVQTPLGAWVAGIMLLALNVIVPLTLGDVYPFTIAPMFRDAPRQYANIRVFDLDGTKLADNSLRRLDPLSQPDEWLLRRYYDGNPIGCGVGIKPPQTLDVFGIVPSKDQVRQHIEQRLAVLKKWPAVEVELEIVGAIDAHRVGVVSTERWKVERPQEPTP
jgi:hypothetical protein